MIDYLVSVAIIAVISGILTLGLNVRWGWAGEFDLSYYAFVAIGAYVGGIVVLGPSQLGAGHGWILGLNQSFPVGLLAAGAVSGLISVAVGAVALRRLRDLYFSITTLLFALIVSEVISQEPALLNSSDGLYGIPQPLQANIDAATYPYFYLALCVVVLAAVYVVHELMYRSPFGRTLRVIREDETAAAAFGRDVYLGKLRAFAIGGAIAGIGGFLFATYLTAWSPGAWSPLEAFLLYSAIFLGGQANARGVLVGMFVVLIVVPEATRFLPTIPGHPELYPALHNIVGALLILAVLRWRPRGIIPEVRPMDRIPAVPSPTDNASSVGSRHG